jgi:hypothetical protein
MQFGIHCVLCLFVAISNISNVTAQVVTTDKEVPVRISLKPDKKTIMLGEPMFIAFEVTNMSGEKLCLGVGGDYRNKFGRPDRFQVSVRTDNGEAVPQPRSWNGGGFIGCDPIEPGQTYTVRLFLSHWATIEHTGFYRINVQRQMDFSRWEFAGSEKPKYSMRANVNAEFTVVPSEENKMGEVINSLGSVMLDSGDPKAVNATTALASIQDKRVITYFAEALRKFGEVGFASGFASGRSSEYSIVSGAITALGTYDDDRAIEALQAAMKSSSQDTRLSVATALGGSPHKSAVKLLLQMQDDSYWFVRLRVAQGLKNVKTRDARDTLQKLLKDENEEVRKAAKETLNELDR